MQNAKYVKKISGQNFVILLSGLNSQLIHSNSHLIQDRFVKNDYLIHETFNQTRLQPINMCGKNKNSKISFKVGKSVILCQFI